MDAPISFRHHLLFTFIFSLVVSACGDSGTGTGTGTSGNTAPVAVAGSNQEVIENVLVTLNGIGSNDADSDPLTYSWILTTPAASTTTVLSDPLAIEPTFTPDVGGIYQASLTVNDGNVDSTVDTVTLFVLTKLTNDSAEDAHSYYNSDGTKIAFHSDRDMGDNDIWVMDADGSNLVQVTSNIANDRRPSWSPDNSQLVFHTDRDGDQNLYTKSSDGTGSSTQLTSNTSNDSRPFWNPADATQIAYQSPRSGNVDIRLKTIGIAGSAPIVTFLPDDTHPMWSVDGGKIAFGRLTGTDLHDIWVMNSDGTNPVQLTNTPTEDEQHADWSPDGSKIAYRNVATVGGTSDIWIMNSDGSNKTQLTLSTADDRNPDWHPDGTKILFRSDRTGNYELFVYPLQ